MPQWGRPPGASKGRRRRAFEEEEFEQRRRWEEQVRVMEIASDDDDDSDGQGVSLNIGTGSRRISGDVDMSPHNRGRPFANDAGSESPSDDELSRDPEADDRMQLVLRDKETLLAKQAMERMERARVLGKSNVKLTQLELDALLRTRQRIGQATIAQRKSSTSSSGGDDLKRTRTRNSQTSLRHASESTGSGRDSIRRKKKGSTSSKHREESPNPPYATGISVPTDPAGLALYASADPYGQNATLPRVRSTRSIHREPNTSRRRHPDEYSPRTSATSFFPDLTSSAGSRPTSSSRPNSARRQPLPHEASWAPRSRAPSGAQAPPYLMDPSQYYPPHPDSPPMPYPTQSSRRNISGPPDPRQGPAAAAVASVRRSAHMSQSPHASSSGSGADAALLSSSSDPTHTSTHSRRRSGAAPSSRRRRQIVSSSESESGSGSASSSVSGAGEDEAEDDGDEDEDAGVEVEVNVIPVTRVRSNESGRSSLRSGGSTRSGRRARKGGG